MVENHLISAVYNPLVRIYATTYYSCKRAGDDMCSVLVAGVCPLDKLSVFVKLS